MKEEKMLISSAYSYWSIFWSKEITMVLSSSSEHIFIITRMGLKPLTLIIFLLVNSILKSNRLKLRSSNGDQTGT
jgi:hypothetical protein